MKQLLWHFGKALLCCLALYHMAGCAAGYGKVYEKDGTLYGVTARQTWRGRWWDYYERGNSYAAGEFWHEAMGDFQAAIQQRAEDQRRARTYGMHLTDYFPHRELGIVYYRLGRYDDALRELETSLHSAATARTKFYLNKTRRALIEQSQRDAAPPTLVLTHPYDGLLTNRFAITVTGHAEDDTYVAALTINGYPLFIELAEPRIPFHQDIELHDGANSIAITTQDLVGKHTQQRLSVYLDRHGPLLSLEKIEVVGTPPHLRLQGLLSDTSGLTRFTLAGKQLAPPPGPTWEWREDIPLTAAMTALPFEAADTAGNLTRGTIPLPASMHPSREGNLPVIPRPRYTAFATNPPPARSLSGALPTWASLAIGTLLSDFSRGWGSTAQMPQNRDRHPPVIKLLGLADQEILYDSSLYLEGQVTDASTITALTVNGESLLRGKPKQLFFSQSFKLQEGNNTFQLEAVDEVGNVAQHTLVVTRHVRPVKQVGSRLRVVLLPFEKKGQTSSLADIVDDALLTMLIQKRRFDFVERQRLEALLQELKLRDTLAQGALADPESIAATGKTIATAEGILVGTVTETARTMEVFARFVDVDTAVVLSAEDVYGEELSLPGMKTLLEGLAWKLQRQLPLVEGRVVARTGQQLLTDLAAQDGVKHSMKLLIFRPGQKIKHPHTDRLMQTPDTVLGEARITAVTPDMTAAQVLPAAFPTDIQESDMVITK